MACATSSLPTPLSPVMSTLASDRAMRSISCDSSAMTPLVPISCSVPSCLICASLLHSHRTLCNAQSAISNPQSRNLLTCLAQEVLEAAAAPIVHRREHRARAPSAARPAGSATSAGPARQREMPSPRGPIATAPARQPARPLPPPAARHSRLMSSSLTRVRSSRRHSIPPVERHSRA